MKLNFFINKNKVFKIYKSYKFLKKNNNLKLIPEIRNFIERSLKVDQYIGKTEKEIHKIFFNKLDILKFNDNFRSHLLYDVINFDFNQSLLLSLKNNKIFHPLPLIFKKYLFKYSIKFSIINNIIWHFKLFLNLQKSFLKIILSYKLSNQQKFNNAIYVHNNEILSENYFKNSRSVTNSNSYMWLTNHVNAKNICIPKLDVNSLGIKSKKTLNIYNWNIFIFWNLFSLVFSISKTFFFYLICNILQFSKYWKYSYMFYEIVQYKNLNKEIIKKIDKFYFDNNYMFNRPLWTYSEIILPNKIYVYFISSNFEFIQLSPEDDIPHSGYKSLDWNNYLVWDDRQKEILNKFNKENAIHTNIEVVSPIPNRASLNDSFEKKLDNNSLILFDVQPFRMSRHIHLGYPNEYYEFQNVKKFYEDILEVVKNKNFKIFFKRKRDPKNIDKRYLNYLNFLKKQKKIIEIDCNINVFNLLDNEFSIKTISLPFTGPAYVSQHFNKINCFYDPTGKLKEIYNNSIRIFNKKEDLKNFIL
jgi:polysaccharide biosynthesis PFTS motif protein